MSLRKTATNTAGTPRYTNLACPICRRPWIQHRAVFEALSARCDEATAKVRNGMDAAAASTRKAFVNAELRGDELRNIAWAGWALAFTVGLFRRRHLDAVGAKLRPSDKTH